MIEVNNLIKEFNGFRALDGVNMNVDCGNIYGLVGPNGAGKSTLIRHLTGVYRQDAGEIFIDGAPVYENKDIKGEIAYIPDDPFYFLQADTLEMMRYYRNMYPSFDEKMFYRLQEFFPGIDMKRNIRRLSKGMQKQVAFWLALCCRPKLLILDEPLDGLDPVMRRQIWTILMSEVAEKKTTVLVSWRMCVTMWELWITVESSSKDLLWIFMEISAKYRWRAGQECQSCRMILKYYISQISGGFIR